MRSKKILISLVLFTLLILIPRQWASAGEVHGDIAVRSTANLKQYMSKFGTMLASLEIIQLKERKIDWEAVDIAVQEMSKTLAELQQADKENAYKEYTDTLAAGMVELKAKSAKRDKTFFDSLNKISESCFRCHAAHRPGDYYFPKDEKKLMSKDAKSPNG